jgi:hypothetical protein
VGKVKQSFTAIGILAASLAVGVSILVWRTGYSITEMDWNSDGRTTVGEIWRAVDVGHRITINDGMTCQEYFSLKDGLPIRVVCPDVSANRPNE